MADTAPPPTFILEEDDFFKEVLPVISEDVPGCKIEEGNILPRENDEEGCVEHKVKISKLTKSRFTSLVTQLKFRLREGRGKAIYYLGITDGGAVSGTHPALLKTSLRILDHMSRKVGNCSVFPEEIVTDDGCYYKVTIIHNISY